MKTFSKVLSMFLVVVMCFGLFATSAYATDILAGSGSDNTGSDILGGGFGDNAGNGDILFKEPDAPAADFNTDDAALADNGGIDLAAQDTAAQDTAAQDVAAQDAAAQNAAEQDVINAPVANVVDNDVLTVSGAPAGNDILGGMSATFNGGLSDTETFDAAPSETYTKGDTSATIKAISAYETLSTYTYSSSKSSSTGTTLRPGVDFIVDSSNAGTLTIAFLNSLSTGTWYFHEHKSDGTAALIYTLFVQESSNPDPSKDFGSPDVHWNNRDYNRNNPKTMSVDKGSSSVNFATWFTAYAYSPNDVWASPMISMGGSGGNNYNIENNTFYFHDNFLQGLNDGTYYLWGYKTDAYGNISGKCNLGYFTINNGKSSAKWELSPDYQIWYSGTDPLTFYSDVFNAAGEGWNYKGYKWDVIVPDIRVSTRSNMAGATSVRIDQYWDLGYGYFMLGQNFLSSLSADETYYMQVIDARHPDEIYTNVVSFRVGPTLRAIDTDKHVINSTRSLRFRSSSPVSEVYVGNIQLTDPADFGVSWDGKTVTLSFEFLNKRSPGNTYTIKVRTTSGEWAATTFQVLTTAQGSASPRTGDESNLGLWAAFLLLSGTAVVVLVPKLKKQEF
ncbi:MAG: hypothetical protein IJV51_06690 [Oscillospiraceae bacterium]|nr:hypothetical protein [Oscillospiraceae bacterium]